MEDSNEKVYGILAYLGILFLVPLLAGKTQFSKYHANQGIVLFIADIILGAVIGISVGVLSILGIIGVIIGSIISGILGLVVLVLVIIGIVHAANGEMKPLPIIGGITIVKY